MFYQRRTCRGCKFGLCISSACFDSFQYFCGGGSGHAQYAVRTFYLAVARGDRGGCYFVCTYQFKQITAGHCIGYCVLCTDFVQMYVAYRHTVHLALCVGYDFVYRLCIFFYIVAYVEAVYYAVYFAQ